MRSDPFPAVSLVDLPDHHERRVTFSAMGTQCEIVIVGGPDLRTLGVDIVADQERRWSRFLPDSDISRANRSSGQPVLVHWTTRDLLMLAKEGWVRTAGRFDPTVGASMEALGYDRSFEHVEFASKNSGVAVAPGCDDVILDVVGCTVTVPIGTRLDVGGIAKGRTGDLVASALMDAGARGACVNIGGDVVVTGEPATGESWVVELANPNFPGGTIGSVRLRDAAIAMSSRTIRKWDAVDSSGNPTAVHHLVDPTTGAPTSTDVVAAAVISGAGWWSDVLTKALATHQTSGSLELLRNVGAGAHGLVVDAQGRMHFDEGFSTFLVDGFVDAAIESERTNVR